MSNRIDLSTFRDALAELEGMYAYAVSPQIMADPALHGYLRTAVIKGFEYTYALSLKFMERFLEKRQPAQMFEKPITFHELLRSSLEHGLINGIEQWSEYRKKRNITSHGYNRSVAEDILMAVPGFIHEANFLLKSLESQET